MDVEQGHHVQVDVLRLLPVSARSELERARDDGRRREVGEIADEQRRRDLKHTSDEY